MKKLIVTTLLAGGCLSILYAQTTKTTPKTYKPTKTEMYRKGWIDFNKNGVKDVYEDPNAPIDARIEDLLGQMTLDEKTCQMVTLYGYQRVLKDDLPTPEWKQALWKDGIGAIDEHLNGFRQWGLPPSDNENVWPASRHAWALNEVQRFFVEETRPWRGELPRHQLPHPAGHRTHLEPEPRAPHRRDNRARSPHAGLYQCLCPHPRRGARPALGAL